MVSVDCEMCITAAGYELTRASLVDDKGQASLGHNLSKFALLYCPGPTVASAVCFVSMASWYRNCNAGLPEALISILSSSCVH